MAKHAQVVLTDEDKRKAQEVAKTTRLRALRLAKEAADRDAAATQKAAASVQPRRRVRARTPAAS
jgi:hypothetical protein